MSTSNDSGSNMIRTPVAGQEDDYGYKVLTTVASIASNMLNATSVNSFSEVGSGSSMDPESVTNYSNPFMIGGPDLEGEFAICPKFLPVNHFYFQIANTFFFLSYLAPNGIYGILYLRVTLAIGSFFFAIWGFFILCALDTCIWNIVFFFINFVHACIITFHLRPIKFAQDLEWVYKQLFLPLRVSRFQFRKVLKCMREVQNLKAGEPFALEKKTKVDKLSLVLRGRFMVSQDGKPLNMVLPGQFLDSPEWFGMSTDDFFQVSVIAVEESRVMVWNRDKLKLSMTGDAFLQAVFDHILGKDVVSKLMQVNETCLSNGIINSDLNTTYQLDKSPLMSNRAGDYEGMNGPGSRHLQERKHLDSATYSFETAPLLAPAAVGDQSTSLNNDVSTLTSAPTTSTSELKGEQVFSLGDLAESQKKLIMKLPFKAKTRQKVFLLKR